MPLQMLEPRRLYRQIADQIGALIAVGEFPPGSRLPPDRDLAQQLGVSRLKHLQWHWEKSSTLVVVARGACNIAGPLVKWPGQI